MKIISFKTCPFVQRVVLVLEAKGLDYEVEYIHLTQKPQWFLEISPHGQVPILITKDKAILFESEAIAEYLEEVYPPKLHSKDPIQRAQERAWAAFGPKCYPLLHPFKEIKNAKAFEEGKTHLEEKLNKIESKLQGPYFYEKLGWVDLAWIPLFHRLSLLEKSTGKVFFKAEKLPKVKAWQKNLMSLPWVTRSVASDFEKDFCKRYITPTNYLGCLSP